MQKLLGKNAIVTAAAAGIGRATCELFMQQGATVWATDIDKDGLEELAEKYQWEIGDKVTLTSGFWPQENGSDSWTFEIVGTYRFKAGGLPSNEFWFHYDYLDEARTRSKGMVHLYFVTIFDPLEAGRIAAEIDREFINATYPTISENEKDWLRGRLESLRRCRSRSSSR